MKIIETGMSVRTLEDDVTGGPQVAGTIGRVEHKEADASGGVLYWVASVRQRKDGETTIDRAPYYAEEIEGIVDCN
jgi:hypothetical protein